MRKAKGWLLLLGTVLVVAGAAVLPQWLSQTRDRAFFDQVNTQEAEDSLFSPVDDLAARLELLARWEMQGSSTDEGGALGFSQELLSQDFSKTNDYSLMTHSNDLEQRVLDALHGLGEELPQIQQLLPQVMEGVEGERRSFYDWDSGEAANFLQFTWFEAPGWQVVMTLDEAMEKVVSLLISGPHLADWGEENREDILQGFLTYLGLTGEDLHGVLDSGSSAIKVADADIYYYIYLSRGLISIQPLRTLPESDIDISSDSGDGGAKQYRTVERNGKPTTTVVENR